MAAKRQLTKAEAIQEIYFEFTAKKRSKAALGRLRRACEALGLGEEAIRQAEFLADYRSHPTADIYPTYR